VKILRTYRNCLWYLSLKYHMEVPFCEGVTNNEGAVFRNLLLWDINVYGKSSLLLSSMCGRLPYLETITVVLYVSVLYK